MFAVCSKLSRNQNNSQNFWSWSLLFDCNLFYDHCSYGSDQPLYFHVKIILAGKKFYMVFVLDCMSFSDVCIMDMDEVIMSSVH